jgi:hypothetical protein
MEQSPINQRLKFLAEKLAGNAHAFGVAIGDKTANTHKYINGNTRPNPEYLQKALLRFGSINARWLLTGEGEPIVGIIDSGVNEPGLNYQSQKQNQKKNAGNIVGNISGGEVNFTALADCAKELAAANEKIVLLTNQLELQNKLIRVYEAQLPKP